jgi:hypothetical protein
MSFMIQAPCLILSGEANVLCYETLIDRFCNKLMCFSKPGKVTDKAKRQ